MKHLILPSLLMIALFFVSINPAAAVLSQDEIPPALAPWQPWVLDGHEQALCPSHYNDGAVLRCRWPSSLLLEVSANGGRFEQRWLMFDEGWVTLPGGAARWPESVLVDGTAAAVVQRSGRPAIRLTPGEHRIMGRFSWQQIPEMMEVPPALGLLTLTIDGRRVRLPVIDGQGRLWLQEGPGKEDQEDVVKVRVFRLLDDTIPMRVTTLFRMDVSGQSREIALPGALVRDSVPMALESQLPARLDNKGRLTVQARAGRWEVRVLARMPGPQYKVAAGDCPHGEEIWSFQPRHDLRMVEIMDVPAVEPSQTEMPSEWRRFSAYLMKPDSAMTIKEVRRGDPDPAPDRLSLHRTWWLDFDGGGFTLRDNISGTLSRSWHLAMNAPVQLGRVAVDGMDRVITEQGKDKKMGVELRRGQVALQADARLPERSGTMSAVGWDHDFQSVKASLHLPPGWRLFATAGVDRVTDTWVQRWSLFDFFLVLIIALAVFKLRSWRWGLLALLAMVLIYHEPGAPRLVWLHLLAVLALTPFLPDGWFKRLVRWWGVGAVVVLLATAVPFVMKQIRWGLYPQLAPRSYYAPGPLDSITGIGTLHKEMAAAPEAEMAPMVQSRQKARLSRKGDLLSLAESDYAQKRAVLTQQDPDALIPTGPGLPDWRWQTIGLSWSGPVAKSQGIRFFLISPLGNLLLALIRVTALVLLIGVMIDWRSWWQKLRQAAPAGAAALLAAACLAATVPGSAQADTDSGAFPPPALLDDLRQRLLEKPDCLPYCADISRMELVAAGNDLQVMLKINCAERVAVPLPVNRKSWTPDQLLLDNAPISGLMRDEDGQMWALVPEGLHTLIMLGSVADAAVVQMPLPLKPHTATYSAEGWRVDGIRSDGTAASTVQLTRLQGNQRQDAHTRANGLPPFLMVERVLHLGLSWHITTTVTRLTPAGTPVVVNVPLLAGESVTSAAVPVKKGHALVNMAPNQKTQVYEATLTIDPEISLTAPRAVPWTEVWVLDAGTMWHCETKGIAAVHHQDAAGTWQPRWQPWPGESLTIHVQRPPAVAGRTKTIDRAAVTLTPGRRFGEGTLTLDLRTSRGGQHTVTLPPNANLQQVTVNGKSLPARQQDRTVTVPLQPGAQQVAVQWHQLAPFTFLFRAPEVAIEQPAANARVTVNMLSGRWILWAGGPRWGPAVLFWSYLVAIVLAALVLGRLTLTPLKRWQWLLLGLGLTQIPVPLTLIIIGWLLVLGFRARQSMPGHWFAYNLVQIGLFIWSIVALVGLFTAVKAGLAGQPDMQILGNQSNEFTLNWTQDRIGNALPRPWVFSLPVWIYHVLMLAWSLWLAWSLLGWLKWGWQCLVSGGGWRKIRLRRTRSAAAKPADSGA